MVSIRKVDSTAIPVIKELAHRIWPVAYKDILSAEQLAYMLDLIYAETALQNQMQQGHQFILASYENDFAGFASYSQKGAEDNFKLYKIYIDTTKQGKGIGQLLLDFVIDDIKTKNAVSLELTVNRHNKALFFYLKNGFEIIREEDFDIGNGYFMNDFVMQLKIENG